MAKKLSDINLRELLLIFLFLVKKHKVGRIKGRTKMQKIMFILMNEFDLPQKFNYFLYTHGPYSASLQGGIDTLSTVGLIEEKTTHLFNFLRYEYSLTPEGEKVAKSFAETLDPTATEIIGKMATRAKELNRKKLESVVEEAYEYLE